MFLILYKKVTDNGFTWSDGFNQFIQAVVKKLPKVSNGTEGKNTSAAVEAVHRKLQIKMTR